MHVDLVSSDANVHVLNDQVRGTVVDESRTKVIVREGCTKLLHQLAFSILLKDYVLVSLNNGKALVELLSTVLIAHPLLELRELTGRNVDHLIFANVSMDVGILAFIVDGSRTLS